MHCALHGSKVSLCVVTATLILGFGVLRQFAPTGAMIGCGAGLIALAALHMSCSDTGVSHLMIWHGSVLIAFGVALGLGGTVLNRWLDD